MIRNIDAKELRALLTREAVFLVDVREASEYRREHIDGAHLFPSSEFNPGAVLKAAGKETTFCVYCASGGRSSKAGESLAQAITQASDVAGNAKVYNLVGGMSAWRMAGCLVVEDKKAPLPIIRQVHLIASTLIIGGSLLSRFYHCNFILVPIFVGCGLFVSGATGFCGMALLLQKLPYNR
ncbi:rhodanese domain-containing protein [Leptomonas pyrrhocoris]|uniref:Rhodanese domain-containing protein n=1 Tax=Leptomonas pyrrhocoris TaxID=157538 RepID=A0A0M9G992_LEPPY|nr:rhodanese domain-containing protein [Leptomonas pyrrhocoris]XP_015663656.1 rhodanese domain-containing protein [Leptomonas pyrrhocoris]KPA85216.1 rhodanese domain-containing protein [Leptomonas pyrrhocoris]KPA85217.1 rhodanese domain-containing protein [Leptomonas pyrrhocoris]|eukprot:XP_015663655.1 rhodanese domain-containing protein [Leptomonas pyrrhocoris]